ncbi:hypothetical protein CYMTET_44095 [Cymbomonas tetramitiformis]|uniref:Uncharacterized protein n=1 Tax=Cymbomonas tetramitiformis TaxID=36881 RepID=A0AAE0F120_9CHLO|nr:hypothetical protein CYMTET_44095 [Cymbomonas tetramitiformis]
MPQPKRLADPNEHETFLRSCQRSDKLFPGLSLAKLAKEIYATQQLFDYYFQPRKGVRRSTRIAERKKRLDAQEEADPPVWQNNQLRAHNINNISDDFIVEVISRCPVCALAKRPKTIKTITAIRAQEQSREEIWDYSDSNEGTDSVLHCVESPGGWQRVYNVNTEKLTDGLSVHMLLTTLEFAHSFFNTQDRYDGKNNGKAPTLQLGDAVLLRRSGPDRSAITTSKLLGFANTGPFVIEEFVGKSSARLRDPLWGTSMPTAVKLERLSLFRRRDSTPVPQFEEILRTQDKPKLDAAYETREKRLQELKADLASRPDAPVCTSCKKKVDRLHAKYMCKPCYTTLANCWM